MTTPCCSPSAPRSPRRAGAGPADLEYLQWLAADVSTGKSRLLMTEGNKRVLGGSQVVRRRIAGNRLCW